MKYWHHYAARESGRQRLWFVLRKVTRKQNLEYSQIFRMITFFVFSSTYTHTTPQLIVSLVNIKKEVRSFESMCQLIKSAASVPTIQSLTIEVSVLSFPFSFSFPFPLPPSPFPSSSKECLTYLIKTIIHSQSPRILIKSKAWEKMMKLKPFSRTTPLWRN